MIMKKGDLKLEVSHNQSGTCGTKPNLVAKILAANMVTICA